MAARAPVPDDRPLGFQHAQRRHRWCGWATDGCNATKKQTISGFKLHLLTAADGVRTDVALAPAHFTDGAFSDHLLRDKADLLGLDDKAYSTVLPQSELQQLYGLTLRTPQRPISSTKCQKG